MYTHCKKCLTSRTGDVLGDPCKTEGCGGVIEEQPAFSTLVDELPEPMICPRRVMMDRGPDHWLKFKAAHGNRVCSCCHSLHPDDLFALVKQCAEAPADTVYGSVVEIAEGKLKIYVRQPGVRNAHEGGIKFYPQHLPRDAEGKLNVSVGRDEEYKRAVAASRSRFERFL